MQIQLPKITKNSFYLLAAIVFFSCNSGKSNTHNTQNQDSTKTNTQAGYDNSLPKGILKDSIICNNDKGMSYALYLPSYYSPEKSFPCIYFFDAHARGAMPVSTYKVLAEQYGFVLIGSNDSKNGMDWNSTETIVKALIQDTRTRIHIDPKRIYTSGFSGGSRVACTIAAADGGIAGVIGCAAGFPEQGQPMNSKFYYFGLVGNEDFNLTEMLKFDETLQTNHFRHQLLTYEGKHGWAPVADFKTALLWMLVNEMKDGITLNNDTIINALKKDFDTRIAAGNHEVDYITAYTLISGMLRLTTGFIDSDRYIMQQMQFDGNPHYHGAVTNQAAMQQQELAQQRSLAADFPTHDVQWWSEKIATLKEEIFSAKTKQGRQMKQRLLSYLSLVGYMYSEQAIKTSNLGKAQTFLDIFKLADPNNPDVCYLQAKYFIRNNFKPQALTWLHDAANKGYSELTTILADPDFNSLHSDADFMKIVEQIKSNQYTNKP